MKSFKLNRYFDDLTVSLDDDLRTKGISCENEAEFSAYYVLTHIKADVLRYCAEMPRHVLDSPQVQFVLKIWRTLQDRNYYRFFRLVEEADYLVACLMHKDFNTMRLTALDIMNRTYVSEYLFAVSKCLIC